MDIRRTRSRTRTRTAGRRSARQEHSRERSGSTQLTPVARSRDTQIRSGQQRTLECLGPWSQQHKKTDLLHAYLAVSTSGAACVGAGLATPIASAIVRNRSDEQDAPRFCTEHSRARARAPGKARQSNPRLPAVVPSTTSRSRAECSTDAVRRTKAKGRAWTSSRPLTRLEDEYKTAAPSSWDEHLIFTSERSASQEAHSEGIRGHTLEMDTYMLRERTRCTGHGADMFGCTDDRARMNT